MKSLTSARLWLPALCAFFLLSAAPAGARYYLPWYAVWMERNVPVPMPDGVKLAADIYHPIGLGKGPVIIVRTPYGKRGAGAVGRLYDAFILSMASRGYTVVMQDCRGRYDSEGEFYPFLTEAADGHATVDWAAAQKWSNGEVGTWGGSYFGFTQWALADGEPAVRAMNPLLTAADIRQIIYEGGAINLSNILSWSAGNQGHQGRSVKPEDLAAGLSTLPLSQADERTIGEDIPIWEDSIGYRVSEVLAGSSYGDRMKQVSSAVLTIAGWYDLFQKYQIEDFLRLRATGAEPGRSLSRIVIGPWGHGTFADSPVQFPNGGIERMPQLSRVMDFYDQLLHGRDRGVGDWPVYTVYVMGAGRWAGLAEWPPAGMTPTRYFLHSGGSANTAAGNGRLSVAAPGTESADAYTYDPAQPVPTTGGPLLGADLGPKLQGPVEARQDVLVYTSEPLGQPLTVMGPVRVVLTAASDATDTDFTAKLCDVFPDGRSVNITDGIIRARFRAGNLARPELIVPGQVYEYTIDLWHTAYQFAPGHRVRVQVSSSNFPRFDRNRNTGDDIATGKEMKTARQSIHHDAGRQSYLLLPVVGNDFPELK